MIYKGEARSRETNSEAPFLSSTWSGKGRKGKDRVVITRTLQDRDETNSQPSREVHGGINTPVLQYLFLSLQVFLLGASLWLNSTRIHRTRGLPDGCSSQHLSHQLERGSNMAASSYSLLLST